MRVRGQRQRREVAGEEEEEAVEGKEQKNRAKARQHSLCAPVTALVS